MPDNDLLSLQVFYSGVLCLHDLVEFSYLTGGLLRLDKSENKKYNNVCYVTYMLDGPYREKLYEVARLYPGCPNYVVKPCTWLNVTDLRKVSLEKS